MYKDTINISLNKYIETENTDDFGKLLTALIPMIKNIAGRWGTMNRHYDDLIQEILLALWKNQRSVNRLKLMRMRANSPNGDGFKVSTYFFFIIRSYCSRCTDKLMNVYRADLPFNNFGEIDTWAGNITSDEGTKKFERGAE